MKLEDAKEMIRKTDQKLDELKDVMGLPDFKKMMSKAWSYQFSTHTIFDQLKNEHTQIKGLLQKGLSSEPRDRASLMDQLRSELIPHARGEEKTLYALVREKVSGLEDESLGMVNDGYEQHYMLDNVLHELSLLDVHSERWLPVFKILKESVFYHIAEEESQMWWLAKSIFDYDDQKRLLEVYLVVKARYGETLPDQSIIREREPAPEAASVVQHDY